jgi:prepilin-type N-terminal cleavage/methylation domain-containing protein
MRACSGTTRRSKAGAGACARGFTIIELLVAIIVIAILMGLLIVVVREALRGSRRAGEQQTATGLQTGVGLFQNTFDNRLPPLVYDGAPIELVASLPRIPGSPGNGEGPVARAGGNVTVAALEAIYVDGGAQFLTGHEAPGGGTYPWLFDPDMDPRYSKFSLPIYLGGVLGEDADGVPGPGMRLSYTNRRGFALGGASQVREAMFQPSNDSAVATSYVSLDEFKEHGADTGGALPTGAGDPSPDRTAYVNGAGVAFRYYRWEHSSDADVGQGVAPLAYLNIPQVLLDPETWDDPAEPTGDAVSTDLRSANYAVVGAGPNGLFGTEPLAEIRARLGIGAGVADEVVRRRAWQDNVVRVGVGK